VSCPAEVICFGKSKILAAVVAQLPTLKFMIHTSDRKGVQALPNKTVIELHKSGHQIIQHAEC
jgi:hypothetical protein